MKNLAFLTINYRGESLSSNLAILIVINKNIDEKSLCRETINRRPCRINSEHLRRYTEPDMSFIVNIFAGLGRSLAMNWRENDFSASS